MNNFYSMEYHCPNFWLKILKISGMSIVFSIGMQSFAGARVSRVPYTGFTSVFGMPIQDTTKNSLKDTIQLQEVSVSTGYQILPKERATGSFVFIDSALFNRSVSTDVISRLKGVTPSLLIDERAGGTPKLSIRGRSTIFANADPLIVVDNFPYEGDLSNLNPNDIADVSILRDAAAASIWGVRAGNGVIVITTKKGKRNQPIQINFNSNLTIGTKPDLFYEPKISPSDLVDVEQFLYKQGYYNSSLTNTTSYPVINPVAEILDNAALSEGEKQIQLDALKQHDLRNDLGKYFYQPSFKQQYDLGMRGGSNKQQYSLNAGFDKNQSAVVGNGDNRFTLSAQQSLQPIANLSIDNAIFYTHSQNRINSSLQGIQNGEAYQRLADDQGNHLPVARDYRLSFAETAEDKGLLNWLYVPLDEINYADQRSQIHHIRFNNTISYSWFKGFKTSLLYQYEKQFNTSRELYSQDTYFTRNLINQYSVIGSKGITYNLPLGAYLSLGHQDLTAHSGRFQADYRLDKGSHSLVLLAGMELRQSKSNGNEQVLYGYDEKTGLAKPVNQDSTFKLYPSGNWSNISSSNSVTQTVDRFRSYYANGSYTYQHRYTLSGSARIDQSNLFGVKANQRSVPLWSVGFKWNAAEEPFYKFDWLPQLNVRATYGYNGNIDNTVTAFTTAKYYTDAETGLAYASIYSLPNADLRGERTSQLNLGIDFGLPHQWLVGSVDYYTKHGKDLLGTGPLESTTGRTSFKGNLANMRGKGLDVMVTVQPLQHEYKWSCTLFSSFTTDEITKYNNTPSSISNYFADGSLTGSSYTPTVGKPLFSVYSYPWAGLDPQTGAPRGFLNGVPSTNYAGITKAYSMDSLKYHGHATPPYYGSFRNDLSYRNFSVSVNISYKLGYYFRRSSIRYDYLFASHDGHSDYANRWQKQGDEMTTDIPALIYPLTSGSDAFYSNSSALVEKGDHIRLQDIQVSYQFRNIHFYVYANNLGILWRTNNQGIDPDYATDVLPQPFTLSAGLTAHF
ncbi:TonB-linked outer membrane protein, SusC/RagA family [bacterium A37T11]|nr:TonB-linked outer membrane protein, SusC/RagA family [bacterium A37T11]